MHNQELKDDTVPIYHQQINIYPESGDKITIENRTDGKTVIRIEKQDAGLKAFFWIIKIAAVIVGLLIEIAAYLGK